MTLLSNVRQVQKLQITSPEVFNISRVKLLFGKSCLRRGHSNGGSQLRGTMSNRSIFLKTNAETKQKPWREAASLLIVAPMNETPPFSLGYLMIERSKGSSLMPGGTVFPGGAVSPVDYSTRWIDLFKSSSSPVDLLSLRFLSENAHIPQIYKTNKVDWDHVAPFSKEIILRITAIRETFEEVGILLCQPRDGTSISISGQFSYDYEELRDRKEVALWQKKIRKDPEEFINLCDKLNCLPDLKAVSEWGNWLSPTFFKPKSRFDTLFYMTVLPKMPRVAYDKHEVSGAQWGDPAYLLKDHMDGKVRLMPPQLYELNRLKNLKTIPELQERLQQRIKLGIERNFVIIEATKDGQFFFLPGDDLYPSDPDFVTTTKLKKLDRSVDEINSESKIFHRGQIKDGVYSVVTNVIRHGQIY